MSVVCVVFCDLVWCDMFGIDCGKLMRKFVDFIEVNKEILVIIEIWDNGKFYFVVLNEDMVELLEIICYYSGYVDKIFG